MKKKIVIIGAGPKALAINAKGYVTNYLNDNIEIVAIDKHGIASNWNGLNGFTSGKHCLGTPPEKDVCFPYMSEFQNEYPDINKNSFEYSWMSFLIDIKDYQNWTDRGKPSPTHSKWASYLEWVGEKTNLNLVIGTVFRIEILSNQWQISYQQENEVEKVKTILADGLVITGPGNPRPLPPDTKHQHYKNGQSYWKDRTFLHTILDKAKRSTAKIGVIGGGETSASIVYDLIDFFSDKNVDDNIRVDIINRHATIFSRGEGFHENKFYTNPKDWNTLSITLRKDFIARTDRGVFSLNTIEKINNCSFIYPIYGDVRSVSARHKGSLMVQLEKNDNGEETFERREYDCVINALGFDNLSFCDIMGDTVFEKFGFKKNELAENRNVFQENIDKYLSFSKIDRPRLFLPMNAALNQGPGFPNLSSLGLVSDRILQFFKTIDK